VLRTESGEGARRKGLPAVLSEIRVTDAIREVNLGFAELHDHKWAGTCLPFIEEPLDNLITRRENERKRAKQK
jgi:hypothetical protein